MNHNEVVLAKKYATAYLNIYGASFDQQTLAAVGNVQELFMGKKITSMVSLPAFGLSEQWQALQILLQPYKLSEPLMKLVHLLVVQSRAVLVPEVFKQIRLLYYERNKIMEYIIATSHPVTEQALEAMQRFIARQTGWSVKYRYTVDPTLIAGIRIASDTVLWEYSISKQLRNVSLSLIR